MKTINERWQQYRHLVYPDGVTSDQKHQLHKAFFAGALEMHDAMVELAKEPQDAAVRKVGELKREVLEAIGAHVQNIKARN